jgi:hypothetical protein
MILSIIRLIILVLLLIEFDSGMTKSTTIINNENECLSITTKYDSYKESLNLVINLPIVKKWSSSLNRQSRIATGGDIFDKTEFEDENCYWSISIYESQTAKLHLWKIFRVNIKNKQILFMNDVGDYQPYFSDQPK